MKTTKKTQETKSLDTASKPEKTFFLDEFRWDSNKCMWAIRFADYKAIKHALEYRTAFAQVNEVIYDDGLLVVGKVALVHSAVDGQYHYFEDVSPVVGEVWALENSYWTIVSIAEDGVVRLSGPGPCRSMKLSSVYELCDSHSGRCVSRPVETFVTNKTEPEPNINDNW